MSERAEFVQTSPVFAFGQIKRALEAQIGLAPGYTHEWEPVDPRTPFQRHIADVAGLEVAIYRLRLDGVIVAECAIHAMALPVREGL